jgi:RNA polymerase sigma-70 factor (ECF subfamily)
MAQDAWGCVARHTCDRHNSTAVMEGESTCWTVVRGAAEGRPAERAEFARLYEPVLRAFFGARWRRSPLVSDLEDAVQEVFLDCFRSNGALARVDPTRGGGFRPFLRGIARNVALRVETERHRRARDEGTDLDAISADEETASHAFDREWAGAVMREAADRQIANATTEAAKRRVELVRLRFHEGMPIRDIANLWGDDAARLHHEYAQARQEFRRALAEVVAFHHPAGTAEQIDREASDLLSLLGGN